VAHGLSFSGVRVGDEFADGALYRLGGDGLAAHSVFGAVPGEFVEGYRGPDDQAEVRGVDRDLGAAGGRGRRGAFGTITTAIFKITVNARSAPA
jgi:hypothetical protein